MNQSNTTKPPHEVVIYKEFSQSSDRLLGSEAKELMVDVLASEPWLGDEIKQTGGIRQLIWPIDATKSAAKGVVFYYYKGRSLPLHLIHVLKPGTKQALAKTIEIIIKS